MNKILYIILIFLFALIVASGIWDFVFMFRATPGIYKLEAYVTWFLAGNLTTFGASILLLKYYYDRGYRFAFYWGIVAVIAALIYTIFSYISLTSGGSGDYILAASLFYICANTVYASGLVFSNTRERIWLKLAGICGIVIGLVLVLVLIINTHTEDARIISMTGRTTRWSPLVGYMADLMFMMNFVTEIRTLKTETSQRAGKWFLAGIMGVLAVVAVVFTVRTAKLLVIESDSVVDWRQFTAVQSQELVGLAGKVSTYVNSEGDSLHYLLIKPMDYDKNKKYPLVVCLPYGGYEAGAAETLSNDFNRYTYRAFIFVPYCPEGEGWGGIPGYPSLESLVYEAIGKLDTPGIDIKRRYVTGVSRGGYGTWEFICKRPDLFAAAVPVCGAGDPSLASKIARMPVWAFHGANDKNVPVSGSRDMISAIKKIGGHPLYTEYPYGTHQIWENVSETPEVWKWLFAQKQQ